MFLFPFLCEIIMYGDLLFSGIYPGLWTRILKKEIRWLLFGLERKTVMVVLIDMMKGMHELKVESSF